MWLDRLGAQQSGMAPSPAISPLPSPLPQRTTNARGPYLTSQRPGISHQGSLLSLASNDSSTSLLGSSKRVNGSSLKQSVTSAIDTPVPERVIEKILGPRPVEEEPGDFNDIVLTESDLELEFDFGGLSLRELAQDAFADEHTLEYRYQSVEDFESEKAKFEELHRSIRACDDVLGSVESNLASFRNDLALVSSHIETLQTRSTALNVRLENRQAVEKRLQPVVEELSVSPLIVSKITEGPVDEAWVRTLTEVEKRETCYKEKLEQSQCKAAADLGPLLEKLISKAVERIRDYLVAQVKALRSPHINAQIIQQQNFLRFRDLYTFLHKQHATLAEELCLAYLNTIRWYYVTQFGRYEKAMEKIRLHSIDKNDVLGHEDTSRKTTMQSGSKLPGHPHDAFNLGRRIDMLKSNDQGALSSYLAEEDQSTHFLEVPFRNFNLALIDNVTAEYTFMATFFTPSLSLATISRHFNYVFEPTFALGQSLTKRLVSETVDALGLLLCVRLNQHFAFKLQRRRVPVADGYINGIAMMLWPRLQGAMDAHCESVRALISALSTRAASAAAARNASAAPHVATQRFGQLLHGILALSADAGDDEPVVTSLRRLRNEMEAFLTRYSQATFGPDKRKRERFLYNNYSLILTIIGDVSGKLAAEQQEHFEGLKTAFRETG